MKCIVCGKEIKGDPVITEQLGDMPACSWKCVDKISGVCLRRAFRKENIIKRYLWWCDKCSAEGKEETLKKAREVVKRHMECCQCK